MKGDFIHDRPQYILRSAASSKQGTYMSNEQPLVSVGSNNRIGNRNIIVVAIIPVLAITTIAIIAIWPFLHAIGLALEYLIFMLIGAVACLLVFAIWWLWHVVRIELRRRELLARVVAAGDVVAMFSVSGDLLHLSALHEQAKLPQLQLQPPYEEQPSIDEWRILGLRSKGMALKDIATACGTTYYVVQKTCKQWEKHIQSAVDGSQTGN